MTLSSVTKVELIYLQMSVNGVSVVLDNPLADLAGERRGLDLATSVLVFVFAPLQVVLSLEKNQ